jgi:DNA-binding response OmpR family regulator
MSIQTADVLSEVIGWERIMEEEPLEGAETILFVEDEIFVREVTCEVLRAAGYRVLTAKNAIEALRVYEVNSAAVDLLLTDVVLPGETGRALARKLRRENPELKVLFVTGYAEQMGLVEAEREQYLAKPFSTRVLLRRLRLMFDREEIWRGRQDLLTLACGNG